MTINIDKSENEGKLVELFGEKKPPAAHIVFKPRKVFKKTLKNMLF